MKKGKVVSAEEAIRVIHNGDTIVVGGFVGTGVPEEVLKALENQFLATCFPKSLPLSTRQVLETREKKESTD